MTQLHGCLWGTALGDALGLCREGLSRRRGQRLYPNLENYQLFGGRGFVSDDTEHAAFTAWAAQDREKFASRLRQALRRWLWSLPAGVGLATLRAGIKVSLGMTHSGVKSAGNGPLMRAPVLGVVAGPQLREWVRLSTELTHTDPRAYQGALLVAGLTEHLCGRRSWEDLLELVDDEFLRQHLLDMGPHPQGEPELVADARGVSGFVYHTAPVVAYAALRHRDDFARAITSVIECGGDTDTTAAIVGGMVGARLGPGALPARWLQNFADRPITLQYLERLACGDEKGLPNFGQALPRNLLFSWCVLGYGLRRLLPPY